MKDNKVSDVSWTELRLTGAPRDKYLILDKNHISEYRIDENFATILDPQQSTFKVQSTLGSKVTVKFTDNKVFTAAGQNKTIFSPSSSSYVTLGDETAIFKTYPMTAKPSLSNVDIMVDVFDTSKPMGDILVKFTADAKNGNSVDFTIGDLQSNANYIINMDGHNFKTLTSDQNGYVRFRNSFWSEHTFTLIRTSESTSSTSDSISPSTGLSFVPSSTSLSVSAGESTTFTVEYDVDFDTIRWYLDGKPVESEYKSCT